MTEPSAGPAGRAPQSKPLYDMFLAVPGRYDLVNRAITWGLDVRWRREAARACLEGAPRRVLDLCCGTGDLVLELDAQADRSVELTGFDFSQPMLDLAAKKAARARRPIEFVRGDASSMPFPEGHFDAVGISFAFRNLTYKNPLVKEHLVEACRVLRPGGRFVIVESSQPDSAAVRALYHQYLRIFVAGVGSALSGNKSAYRYLAESAKRFHTREEIRELLTNAGFREVSFQKKLLGAVAIHVAVK